MPAVPSLTAWASNSRINVILTVPDSEHPGLTGVAPLANPPSKATL